MSALGNILPFSSARLPACTKIVMLPVRVAGGVNVYAYVPGAVCFNDAVTVVHDAAHNSKVTVPEFRTAGLPSG